MKPKALLPAWEVVGLLALGGVACLCLNHRPDAGPPAGRAPEARAPGAERQAALDDYQEDLLSRVERRQSVLREVIAGRMPLAEAAAQFQQLDAGSKTFNWEAFRSPCPGASDEERQCRAVIGCVSAALGGDPEQARAVTRRLEAELQAFLAKNASGPPEGASARGRAEPTH